MSMCFYTLTNVTDVIIKLDVHYYIMLKVFATNDFIYSFYFEMFLLQIVMINTKYF